MEASDFCLWPKYSAVWIVREIRLLQKQRLAEEPGWLTQARIDEIERSLWRHWRQLRAEGKR
jgi:hypothetical protein